MNKKENKIYQVEIANMPTSSVEDRILDILVNIEHNQKLSKTITYNHATDKDLLKLNKPSDNYFEIFNNSPEACFILDKEGLILDINEMGSCLLDSNSVQLIGKPFSSFLPNDSLPNNFFSCKDLASKKGRLVQIECEMNRIDKTSFHALIKNRMIINEASEFKYFLATVIDITKWKEQERKIDLAYFREKELNMMKSRFITMASHEFRTPLASILSSTELIEKYKNETEGINRGKHIHKIKSSVQKLSEILIDFLSTNKIESGEVRNNPEVFDLDELIANLKEEIEAANVHHKISFIKSKECRQVHLDTNLLKLCLTKLIENAIKYSPNNATVEILAEYNKSENFIILIKDSGIGIPESDKKNIFTQFFKGKNAENIEGNGLGLYDVNKLISLMGGRIDFNSTENIGTTFKLEFQLN